MPVRRPYPKEARLRLDRDFQPVRTKGRRMVGRVAVVRAVENGTGRARLGIATSKKYGKAVRRNRFRRLAREAFRGIAATLGPYDLLVEPRRDVVRPSLDALAADFVAAVAAARRAQSSRP